MHAKLVRASPEVVNLIDLQSTNGTFVNGQRIRAVILGAGDEIQLGPNTVARFSCGPQTDAAGISAERARIEGILTRRELEVACLVARGLTNRRIARDLGVSARTVESHLDHAYNKLDIDSRAALTALLYEAGLVGGRRSP